MDRAIEYQQISTITKLFDRSVGLFRNNPLIYEKKDGAYTPVSYSKIQEEARSFGLALLQMGFKKGDRMAILSEGRREWLTSELGMFYVGVINVPLSIKLSPEEVAFRIEHSGASAILVSRSQAQKAESLVGNQESLRSIIYYDEKAELPCAVAYSNMVKLGRQGLLDEELRTVFSTACDNISPNDIVNISYTSGTTSMPKGIMLTQRNYAANVMQACTRVTISPSSRSLAILPWDHSFAHTANLYSYIYYGGSIACQEIGRTPIETLKNIPKNINEIKPDLIMSVPALSKSFRKNIENGIRQKGDAVWNMFEFFRKVSYAYNGNGFNRGKGFRALLYPIHKLGDKLLYSKVRQTMGGNLRFFIGGGALLDIELQRFFAAIGIPIMQGYGLSEASPVISTNSLERHKFGTSGMVLDFLEVKICDAEGNRLPQGEKGELVIKGDNVMAGYWKNPEATAETIVDGWLHTGDLGYFDEDGFLVVVGRSKSLLIGSDGEKYSPEGIEESLVDGSPYIDQCMLYNNQSSYTMGLLVPNVAALKRTLSEKKLDLSQKEGQEMAISILKDAIDQYRKGGKNEGLFPERWLPTVFVIADEAFTEANHMLNSTMKMVRAKVVEHYSKEIDFAYTPNAKDVNNDVNRNALAKLQ